MRWTWRYYNERAVVFRLYCKSSYRANIWGGVFAWLWLWGWLRLRCSELYFYIHTSFPSRLYACSLTRYLYSSRTALVCEPPSYNLSVKCDGKLRVCPARSFIPAFMWMRFSIPPFGTLQQIHDQILEIIVD